MATISQNGTSVTVNIPATTNGGTATTTTITTDFYAGRPAANVAVGLGALMDNKQTQMTNILSAGSLDSTKLASLNMLQNDIANLSNAQKVIQNSQREMAKIISG